MNAYTAATAAASVGVKIPLTMPPSRITGVKSGRNAARNVVQIRCSAVAVVLGHELAKAPEVDQDHEGQPHEHARHEPSQKEPPDGHLGHGPIDHHGDAGRDDRSDGGRGHRHRRGILLPIPLVGHGLDLDHTETARVCHGGSGHPSEDHARENVGMGQAAANGTHQGAREVEEAIGDPALVHQATRQHEERNRDQHEGIDAGDHALRDPDQRERGKEADRNEDRHPQPHRHGHARHGQDDKTDDHGGDHRAFPPTPSDRRAARSTATNATPWISMTAALTGRGRYSQSCENPSAGKKVS